VNFSYHYTAVNIVFAFVSFNRLNFPCSRGFFVSLNAIFLDLNISLLSFPGRDPVKSDTKDTKRKQAK